MPYQNPYLLTMVASRKNSSPARLKAHSFARWLVLCVFLAAATNGSALAKLHAPTSTSELVAGEREAAEKTNSPLSPYHQFPIVVGAENGSVIEFGKVTGLPTNYGPNSGISIEIKGNQPLYPFELQPDGKIKVTQNYQLVEYYDGVYFTNPGSTNEDIVIYSLNDYYYLDPYEFVDVVIGENYGGAGYDKGDVLHVPVIMAMLITQAIENDRFDQNFRIATDIVEIVAGVGAIVAAAPTGGGSLLLYAGIVESIAASADIAIASHQNTLPTAEYNANFYKSWQQVKMIVDIGSGIIAVPSLIQGGIKLGQSVFRYGRNMAFAISLRRAVRITNYANDVENIYDLERALDISEAFSKGQKLEEVVSGAGGWLDDLDVLLGAGTKTKVNNWISNGLSESKLQAAFSNSTDKAELLNKLETSKSIYHQRVHIADWDNIPGIMKSNYTSNGLTTGKTHTAWNNPALDLPSIEAANFVNATAVELPAGTKIYRVTGGNPAGAYWTIQKPNSVGDVIGGTAVQPAWNDFSKIYVYEVPQGQTLKVWQGTTARQRIAQGVENPHLPGGDQQLFIPDIVRDNAFKNLVQPTTLPW